MDIPSHDRRAEKRLRVNCTVIYRPDEPVSTSFMLRGEALKARMLDLSQSGMAMITSRDIPTETILSLRFTLLKVNSDAVNFSGPMEITGEVRSNTPCGENEHRLGIHFTKARKIPPP